MTIARKRASLDGGGTGFGSAPPKEIRIFKFGVIDTTKGKFLFDDKAAKSVMSAWTSYGNDLCFDYEHKAVDPDGAAGDGKAAGWYQLAVKGDGLYAVNIKWTPAAAAGIAAKEWRYFSPTFDFDSKTGRILELVNVALTNIPATKNLPALVAAQRKKTMATKKTTSKAAKKNAKLGVKKVTKTSETTEYDDATDGGDDDSKKDQTENDELDDAELDDDDASLDDGDDASLDDAELDDAELDDAELDDDGDDDGASMKKTAKNGRGRPTAPGRVAQALSRMNRENAKLSAQLERIEARQKRQALSGMVERAVQAGKILPAARASLMAMGQSNPKALRAYLGTLPGGAVSITTEGRKPGALPTDNLATAGVDSKDVEKMQHLLGTGDATAKLSKESGGLERFSHLTPMKLG